MLAPGGRLWLSQPNLASLGLQRFGSDWRGLEPPRHLSLYNFKSLERLLSEAGFTNIAHLEAERAAHFYFQQSKAMSEGLDPYRQGDVDWMKTLAVEAAAADRKARKNREMAESLTVVAYKPATSTR